MTTVEPSIASKVNEIKSLPYAQSIVSEDVIERNFGYKIIRHQVSSGRRSIIYKCESVKRPDAHCIVKSYSLGKDRIRDSLKEETCHIMRYVTGKCAQIISTYDIYYTNDKIYLMSDWSSKGEVLANLKSKAIRLNEEMLRNWTIDILSAVNFLHGNAICHRNIAPSCLLLTIDNRIKIGTLSDAVVYCKPDGTLIKQKWGKFQRVGNWNQPPEVAKGESYDPRRSDIWSIGATIYWFIAKTYPIDYRSRSRLTKQLEHKLSIMRKVTNRCQSFVKRMLTYQPRQRPSISQAMELEWITSEPSPSRSTSKKPAGAPEASPEITVHLDKAEPGEAVGPDEPTGEAEAETSIPKNSSKSPSNNGH